ncbi:hypothetical protein AURDEDRAFT_184829 [Auricularia subglabra TFB-10046 SS5]|nr:hypothetical protein AURDEDRAFT_184829 [Auricularia subglabra TFB-10046 SS5]
MDFLDLSDLLLAMAVNRRWKDVALDHPTYWRDLRLDERQSSQPDAVRFFRLRLSRSRGRPVNIALKSYPLARSEREILPDIAQHLSHIQQLDYISHQDDITEAIFDALARPAPILDTLRLIINSRGGDVQIRSDFLAGFAPGLCSVVLGFLDLPFPIPPCLRRVEHLRVSIMCASVPDLSQGFPDLVELHLCQDVTLRPAFFDERAWRGIQYLCIDGGEIARKWHRLGLPIDRISSVVIKLGYFAQLLVPPETAASLAALAAHLDGGIGVHIAQHGPSLLSIDLRGTSATSSDLDRGVLLSDYQLHLLDADSRLPFPGDDLSAGFAGRVVYITLSLDNWDLACCLGALPVLESLLLSVENGTTPENPRQLSCPRLKRLILRTLWNSTGIIVVVEVAPFAQFARAALHDAPFPLSLELQQVELLTPEEIESVSSTFRSATTTQFRGNHPGRWL